MKKTEDRRISRRNFIKKVGAGIAVALIAIGTMFPGISAKAFAAEKEYILIGRPQPSTGPMAAFTDCSPWVDNFVIDEINKQGGVYIKEYGKKLPIKVKIMDTQSDPTKAAEIASRLILKDKVDIMYASHAPATVNPVAQTCERFGMPCLGTHVPVEMFMEGGPYKWSFAAGSSVADFMVAYLDMWEQVETNKVVGLLAANEVDGIAFADGAKHALPEKGYTIVDPGRFPAGTMDFTSLINEWKKGDVEIVFGNLTPPDFARVWQQCFRQGYLPKVCSVGMALTFPSAVEAIGGGLGAGTASECAWHPSFPFQSFISGITARELCDIYERENGKQWVEPIGATYCGYEILTAIFKEAQTLDKEVLRETFKKIDVNTIWGRINFGDKHAIPTASGGQQWLKGDKYPFELKIVSAGNWKNVIYPEAKLISLHEIHK